MTEQTRRSVFGPKNLKVEQDEDKKSEKESEASAGNESWILLKENSEGSKHKELQSNNPYAFLDSNEE